MLKIIRAQPSDVVRIASLVRLYWEFEGITGFDLTRTEDNLTTLLSLPERGACWLAESVGEIAGYLIVVYVFSLEHGGRMAEIDEFFVCPEYRSAGTGAALLLNSEREMMSMGIVHMQLQLGLTNGRARTFYERYGYRRRGGYELLEKPLSSE
jgi:GNAT superfamily N-acetyltransferase